MYGLALCLPSVGQPQGLPVPHEIPKTQLCKFIHQSARSFYGRAIVTKAVGLMV